MPFPKNNKIILVSPLDWGLGHATRCIPVIRALAAQGCTVIIAASGAHAALLQQEFPAITVLPIQGYNIRYGNGNLIFQLLRQLPAFIKTIKTENNWLENTIEQYNIDGVISDNRYGLFSNKVPCVLITHQLQIQTPGWLKWTKRLVQKQLFRFIQKFAECWVPDVEPAPSSLGGNLSHPAKLPSVPTRYIGWLTRFYPQPAVPTKFQLLISLSGPEPQRTILEKILLSQLSQFTGRAMLVRGLPGATNSIDTPQDNVTIVNHLPGKALQQAIAESAIFVGRCGYSTLMDLQTASCRCIFIPTPGQTEQEYLGQQLAAGRKAVVMSQKNFDLKKAIEEAARIPPFSSGNYQNADLDNVIANWLTTLG